MCAAEEVPSSIDATEGYFKEYEQAVGTYRFTYQTIWQAGSVFVTATAAIIAIAASGSGGVDTAVQFLAPLPFLFWWWGVYRPMNRYGEIHSERAAEIEAMLNGMVPDLAMNHFRTFDSIRKTRTGKERLKSFDWVLKPRVSEVVNTLGIGLVAVELLLLVVHLTVVVSFTT